MPVVLTNGTTADATQVMADLDNILNCINASLAPLINPDLVGSVGINSPIRTAALQVVGSGATEVLQNLNTSGYAGLRVYNDQNTAYRALEIDYSGSAYTGPLVNAGPMGESASIATTGAFPLALATSNTARLIIDAYGNIGIGVAPSPWIVYQKGIDFGGAGNYGGLSARAQDVELSNNSYIDNTAQDIYKNTGPAAKYLMANGVHQWVVAASGTAGTPIAWTTAMTIDGSGRVGIGTYSPTQALEVVGEVKIGTFASASATPVCQIGNVLSDCSSSIRYKENVENAPYGLNEVMRMRPVTFKWKGRDERDLGFVAEEVAKINPLFVIYKNKKIEGVKYSQLVAVLTKAIQEQQQELRELISANEARTKEIGQLRTQMDELRKSSGMRTAQN